jgi:hypothetical protein
MSPLVERAVELAVAEASAKVREHGHNRGPEVDQYCRDIGHDPTKADPWCVIFVAAMFKRASDLLGVKCPVPLVAGCWTVDQNSPHETHSLVPVPGAIFLTLGHKHCGLVIDVLPDGTLSTVSGNTNAQGSAEGDCVYIKPYSPSQMAIYLDYSRITPSAPVKIVA